MQFHGWQTLIDEFRRINPGKYTDQEVYQIECDNILKYKFSNETNRQKRMIRLGMEYSWIKDQKPYYNVHPKMVQALCKTNLDTIPAKFIETPGNLRVVNFRFSEDIPIQYTNNSGLFLGNRTESLIGCRSVLFFKEKVPKIDGDTFGIILDEGIRVKDKTDRMLCNTVGIQAIEGHTIPQAIEYTMNKIGVEHSIVHETLREYIINLFKVIISGGFLANTPEENLVVPDVLSKDKDKYNQAIKAGDSQKIKVIIDRAKRNGKNGFNIGTNQIFVDDRPIQEREDSNKTGRELTYSHIRLGHPTAIRYGVGKNKVKIKWIRSVRVRKDLPFK